MLTRKQQVLLQFIHERLQSEGVPPSFEEMKEALDLKSKSGIHRLIMALEERGFIRRLHNRARALEVIKLPENWTQGGSGSVIEADFGSTPRLADAPDGPQEVSQNDNVMPFPGSAHAAEDGAGISVPVMGKIAAGVPIEAIQDNTHSVSVPPEMIGTGDHFALTVEGDSMVEAGILDGDTVIIRQTPKAQAGEFVVALVDDEEATLKTFRSRGDSVALEAANPAYETRILPADRVKVQGRLVGLIRNYH